MGVEVAGLVVLVVFYVVILVVGVFAARRKQRGASLETSIVADRDINTLVGVFTMTGTKLSTSLKSLNGVNDGMCLKPESVSDIY